MARERVRMAGDGATTAEAVTLITNRLTLDPGHAACSAPSPLDHPADPPDLALDLRPQASTLTARAY
eukprot:2924569-Rhodomonas_salina.1